MDRRSVLALFATFVAWCIAPLKALWATARPAAAPGKRHPMSSSTDFLFRVHIPLNLDSKSKFFFLGPAGGAANGWYTLNPDGSGSAYIDWMDVRPNENGDVYWPKAGSYIRTFDVVSGLGLTFDGVTNFRTNCAGPAWAGVQFDFSGCTGAQFTPYDSEALPIRPATPSSEFSSKVHSMITYRRTIG